MDSYWTRRVEPLFCENTNSHIRHKRSTSPNLSSRALLERQHFTILSVAGHSFNLSVFSFAWSYARFDSRGCKSTAFKAYDFSLQALQPRMGCPHVHQMAALHLTFLVSANHSHVKEHSVPILVVSRCCPGKGTVKQRLIGLSQSCARAQ